MSAADRIDASSVAIRDFAGRETATALAAGYVARTIVYDAGDTAELGWQDQALCAQVDPEIFFPEKGGSVRRPKRVCARCDVRAECLEYALDTSQAFGIWGGMTERERYRLKREAA
jgi:WhiB family redox-sensing transcriptional regulator